MDSKELAKELEKHILKTNRHSNLVQELDWQSGAKAVTVMIIEARIDDNRIILKWLEVNNVDIRLIEQMKRCVADLEQQKKELLCQNEKG